MVLAAREVALAETRDLRERHAVLRLHDTILDDAATPVPPAAAGRYRAGPMERNGAHRHAAALPRPRPPREECADRVIARDRRRRHRSAWPVEHGGDVGRLHSRRPRGAGHGQALVGERLEVEPVPGALVLLKPREGRALEHRGVAGAGEGPDDLLAREARERRAVRAQPHFRQPLGSVVLADQHDAEQRGPVEPDELAQAFECPQRRVVQHVRIIEHEHDAVLATRPTEHPADLVRAGLGRCASGSRPRARARFAVSMSPMCSRSRVRRSGSTTWCAVPAARNAARTARVLPLPRGPRTETNACASIAAPTIVATRIVSAVSISRPVQGSSRSP